MSTIVAVTGLEREARIIARPDLIIVVGGGDSAALKRKIRAAVETGGRRIFSIGICGALSPRLQVGDCIIATAIVAGGQRLATDEAWSNALLAQLPGAQLGVLGGSDSIIADRADKERLYRATRAIAVDMESHIAAMIAQEEGLPFAAMRIVSDSYRQSLPPAALAAMAPSGKVDIRALLRSVASKPMQIPALLRTAWEAEKAFRVLARCRHVTGERSGPDV